MLHHETIKHIQEYTKLAQETHGYFSGIDYALDTLAHIPEADLYITEVLSPFTMDAFKMTDPDDKSDYLRFWEIRTEAIERFNEAHEEDQINSDDDIVYRAYSKQMHEQASLEMFWED